MKVNLIDKQFLITHRQTNYLQRVFYILQVEAFCDVTLAVDGASIKCHKMVRSNHNLLAGSKDPLDIIFSIYLPENDYLLNLGSGRLFKLLSEPFHGKHLQTPDRLPQGGISLCQDIRFNRNKTAHPGTEYLKQYFLSRIFGLTRSGPCWTTCTMERYAKYQYIMG